MKIDLTPIFQALIALCAALVTYKLIPWIKAKTTEQQQTNIAAAAKVAVYAAEQIFKVGDNAAKLDYAIGKLEAAGFTADRSALRQAIESAVHEMNLSGKWFTAELATAEEQE